MKYHTLRFVVSVMAIAGLSSGEQYLRVSSGKRYLGHVSSADKKKFIFCDARVGDIPDGSALEDTLEKCASAEIIATPLDAARYRILSISEGAAQEKNPALATQALDTLVKIQNSPESVTEEQAKSDLIKIESKAGFDLKKYLDKGAAVLPPKQKELYEKYLKRP